MYLRHRKSLDESRWEQTNTVVWPYVGRTGRIRASANRIHRKRRNCRRPAGVWSLGGNHRRKPLRPSGRRLPTQRRRCYSFRRTRLNNLHQPASEVRADRRRPAALPCGTSSPSSACSGTKSLSDAQ